MSTTISILVLIFSFKVRGSFPAPQMDYQQVTALPEGTSGCKNDENINECIRSALQEMIKRSKGGVPELNIPPIDPFVQDKITMQFENNFIQGRVTGRNIRAVGISKAIVEKVDFKKDGNTITFNTVNRLPKLRVDGQYKSDVVFNNNKLSAKGSFNATMSDIEAIIESEGELYERDGRTYVRVTKFNIDPTIGNMRVSATGLLPDKTLNDALVDFANQNWRQAYKSVIPETRVTWEPLILKYINEFFDHLPFDLLYLEA
ncbi:protein takeout-like [Haematobia irritans]|uniref:protein takeout-like n=1 Tax=Haematobia irritans TaxID=7368 RepID=UPI003F4FECE7